MHQNNQVELILLGNIDQSMQQQAIPLVFPLANRLSFLLMLITYRDRKLF